ncbi:Ribosomal biogenesis protein Gar2 [Penicillium verhagenii]|nr:Ribosomal biogenesis protein Gar2 [Penicillium verhagenii]
MAPAKKDMKRKAPAVSDPPAKKTKKVQAKPAETSEEAPKSILKKKATAAPKAKETKTAAPVKANGTPARQAKPRKRAADFISDEETEEPAAPSPVAEKKTANKKSKKEETAPVSAVKKAKATPKAKKVEEVAVESEDDEADLISLGSDSEEDEESEDEVLDDQTAALIKGFESSDDEDESEGEGHNPNKPVPKIPDTKKAQRKIAKSQKDSGVPDTPGTVYVGRIPHGFYEHEMRAYFSQFGEITRLRLSRNRLTGRSKHYAFVEFTSTTVAKIVAETMDNYLMYSHILKCKFVPQEQLHPEVWKGANRRFKKTPWNRIEKKRLEKGKTREQWTKRIEQEQKRRQAKIDKLQALGYDIELPQLKSVDDVPVQEAPKAIEATEATETIEAAEPTKAVEAAVEEPVKVIDTPVVKEDTPKKGKKGKKVEKTEDTPKPKATTESPAPKKKAAKKTKAKA